jgi:hypothetical protein
MKRYQCLMIALVSLVGCGDPPIEPVNFARLEVSSAWGYATYDSTFSDSIHRDHSGVRVELLKTKHATVADRNGYWRIDSIPAGFYDVCFSRAGYDTIIHLYQPIFAPAGRGFLDIIELRWRKGGSLFFNSAAWQTQSDAGAWLYSKPEGNVWVFELYLGRSRSVSPVYGAFDAHYRYSFRPGESVIFVRDARLRQDGFRPGDSVYAVAYYQDSIGIDGSTGTARYINSRCISNTIGFRIP